MENSFKVGDRVRCIKNIYGYLSGEKLGTVCSIQNLRVGVAFDEEVHCLRGWSGHTCNGLCADGHGLWCSAEELIPAVFKKTSEREYITEMQFKN